MSKLLAFRSALIGSFWAIDEARLQSFRSIALSNQDADYSALQAYRGQEVNDNGGESFFTGKGARSSIRGDIGILDIRGPLVKNDDLYSWYFGTQTYESLALEFNNLLADNSVKGIILEINSPGGEVAGASEFANMVFAARGSKEKGIIARVGGDANSAAYWIASATEKILIDNTAMAGSIGVVASFLDTTGWEEMNGLKEIEIVSTNAPDKRIDVTKAEGVAKVRKTLDALEAVFISDVARNRGVSTETVKKEFGKGGIFVGEKAVEAGLVDGIESFEGALAALNSQTQTMETPMTEEEKQANAKALTDATAKATSDAIAAETARTAGIMKAFEGSPCAADMQSFITGNKTVAEANEHVVEAMKKAPAPKAETPAATPEAGSVAGAMAAEAKAAADAATGDGTDAGAGDLAAEQAEFRKNFAAGASAGRTQKFGAAAKAGTTKIPA